MSEPGKPFNGKPYANFLIVGGIVGLIYSFIFSTYYGDQERHSENSFINYILTPFWKEHVHGVIIYYITNSLLSITTGAFLKMNKRLGFYALSLLVVSILASFAIRGDNTNLFAFTFNKSVDGMLVLAPIGATVFVIAIVVNLIVIKKWWLVTKPVKLPQ